MASDQFLTLRQASSSALTSSSPTCDPRMAARLAAKLFGCYRASDANNPEAFLAAATAMLAQYPEAVASKVCDPIRGLCSTAKWLPAIAEIREACEREMIWHDAVEKRDREREHTRAVLAGHKAAVGSPEHQRVVKDFKELAGLWPKAAARQATEPKDYARVPPPVKTPEMARYLADMQALTDEVGALSTAEGPL